MSNLHSSGLELMLGVTGLNAHPVSDLSMIPERFVVMSPPHIVVIPVGHTI